MIKVSPVPDENLYRLCETTILKGYTIPEGFTWDGASVPGALWDNLRIYPFHPKVMRASLLHDFLYTSHDVDRDIADNLFQELLIEDGVERYKVNLMYFAVRNWGEKHWSESA